MSDSLPSTNSVANSDVRPPSFSPSELPANNPTKRRRVEEDDDATHSPVDVRQPRGGEDTIKTVEVPTPATTSEGLSAALRIIEALKEVWKLPAIGDCPTVFNQQSRKMLGYGPDDLTQDDVNAEDYGGIKREPEEEAMVERNEERFEILAELMAKHGNTCASGFLQESFNLKITRPGCEFDDLVVPTDTSRKYDKEWRESLGRRLQRWYDNAAVSGYGDVRQQLTRVDEEVRTAREIDSSEFTVDPKLLKTVESLWTERFTPSPCVRAEPYKIHLYGPDGHFRSHRDTPQKDLVGTFLVGLGNTAWRGGLVVEGKEINGDPGTWCGFYPDVPHRVDRVHDGYRAVIAFKLFRMPTSTAIDETEQTLKVRQRVAEIIREMEAPYGILLGHKYSLGTEQFNGFDAILTDSVRSKEGVDVHQLPVVVKSCSTWGSHDRRDCWRDFTMSCETTVYPFTSGYIDALADSTEGKYGRHCELPSAADCGCPWLEGVTALKVPFFSLDLSRKRMFPYKEEEDETCNYTGNEAQAWREDSVYLSYALMVLPRSAEPAASHA